MVGQRCASSRAPIGRSFPALAVGVVTVTQANIAPWALSSIPEPVPRFRGVRNPWTLRFLIPEAMASRSLRHPNQVQVLRCLIAVRRQAMPQPDDFLARVGVTDAPKVRSPGRQVPVREDRADQRPDVQKLGALRDLPLSGRGEVSHGF